MGQQEATAFDVIVIERVRFPRAHDFEKQDRRILARQNGAQSMMQVLRLQPLGVKLRPYQVVLWHELSPRWIVPGTR